MAPTVFGIFTLVCIQIAASAVLPELREDGETARIIGGQNASPGQFPYAVALFFDKSFICTASIIGETSVLTAAHCVVDAQNVAQAPNRFYAIANVQKSSPTVKILFSQLTVHPNYGNLNNDIAIFRTTEPIPFSANVGKVCVASPATPNDKYTNATAMGWGNTSPIPFLPPNIPDKLQYVQQFLLPICPLLSVYGNTKDKICAGGLFNGVCNGDSGGPLVHLSATQPPVQIGITSYGNALLGCGKLSPAVWTAANYFNDFIVQNTGGDTVCFI